MSAPTLAVWALRTGVTLATPAHVQPAPDGEGLALVDRKVGLALVPAAAETPARSALDAQLAPFLAAGVPAPEVLTVPCRLVGAPAECLAATLEVAPGASLRLLAGSAADWAAVCLDRGGAVDRICGPVIQAVAASP